MTRNAHDTFLHFLADNISTIPIKELRREAENDGASKLKRNALNVKFFDATLDPFISGLQVTLDVINDDQLIAMDWLETVYGVLSAAYMAPLYDYSPATTGGQPVPLHRNMFWKRQVRFRPVKSEYYFHYSATLTLYY